MADRKSSKARGGKPKVIDVGDKGAEATASDEDAEDKEEADDDLVTDVASRGGAIEVAPDDDDAPAASRDSGDLSELADPDEVPEKPSRGGSLARRDPMAAYMSEVRRYPLLTPEEEKALATRLVEHG